MLIASYAPGEIFRYNFSTGALTLLTKKLGSCDGIKYDPYGNLYAVANHNTIVQINPTTGAIINTLVLEPHHGQRRRWIDIRQLHGEFVGDARRDDRRGIA